MFGHNASRFGIPQMNLRPKAYTGMAMRQLWHLFILPILSCLIMVMLPGCKNTPQISDASITSLLREQLIDLQATPHQKVLLVDVRSADAFSAGHLRGAIHMYLPQINSSDPRLLAATVIVVYGSGEGADPLVHAAVKKMLALGYQDVYDYPGGIKDWLDSGAELADVSHLLPAAQP